MKFRVKYICVECGSERYLFGEVCSNGFNNKCHWGDRLCNCLTYSEFEGFKPVSIPEPYNEQSIFKDVDMSCQMLCNNREKVTI